MQLIQSQFVLENGTQSINIGELSQSEQQSESLMQQKIRDEPEISQLSPNKEQIDQNLRSPKQRLESHRQRQASKGGAQKQMKVKLLLNRKKSTLTNESSMPKQDGNSKGKQNNFLRLLLAKKYLADFIENLMTNSYVRNINQFNEYQTFLLDDLKTDGNDQLKILRRGVLYKQISEIFQNIPVFDPNDLIVKIWNFMVLIDLAFSCIYLPFKISFQDCYYERDNQRFNNFYAGISILIRVVDICFQLNIASIQGGFVEKSRQGIVKNYIRTSLFSDMISLSIFSFSIYDTPQHQIELIIVSIMGACYIYNRIAKIKGIVQAIPKYGYLLFSYFHLTDYGQDIFELLKLSLGMLILLHFSACIWHGAAAIQSKSNNNWMDQKGISHANRVTKYLYSFYWSTMTMTTVGYGDIIPQNDDEIVVAFITMIFSCAVFAFSINSLGMILQNINSRHNIIQKNTNSLNRFLRINSLSLNLQTRIRGYLYYIWQEEKEINDEEFNQIQSKLDDKLKEEMNLELRLKILKACPTLRKFGDKLLRSLTVIMSDIRYIPGQQIFQQDSYQDCSVYFITKGSVELCYVSTNNTKKALKTLQVGETFGEYSFFTGQSRQLSAFSKEFTQLYKIDRNDMLKIINQQFVEREYLCHIRDQALFNSDFTYLNLRCYSCDSQRHLVSKCPIIHYRADKERVIKKDMFPFYQKRSLVRRSITPYSHFSTLFEQPYLTKFIQEKCQSFNLDIELLQPSIISSQGEYDEPENQDQDISQQQSSMIKSQIIYRSDSSKQIDVIPPKLQNFKSDQSNDTHIDQIKNNNRRPRVSRGSIVYAAADVSSGKRKIENSNLRKNFLEVRQQSPRRVTLLPNNQSSNRRISSSTQIKPIQSTIFSLLVAEQKPITATASKPQYSSEIQPTRQISPPSHLSLDLNGHSLEAVTKVQRSQRIDTKTINYDIKFSILQMDQMVQTKVYFPLNNYETVIKRYRHIQKFMSKLKTKIISHYTFQVMAIKKAEKMRQFQRISLKSLDYNPKSFPRAGDSVFKRNQIYQQSKSGNKYEVDKEPSQ